jgi:hypothetical protein
MNQESLKQLAGISNIEDLRRAIEAMCLPYGPVAEIRLLPDTRGQEYLCFVKLASFNLNSAMIDKLGGISFGNSVAFRIPFVRSKD